MMHLNTVAAEGMTRLLRSLYLQCGDGEEAESEATGKRPQTKSCVAGRRRQCDVVAKSEQRPPRDLRAGIATPCGRGYRYDCIDRCLHG